MFWYLPIYAKKKTKLQDVIVVFNPQNLRKFAVQQMLTKEAALLKVRRTEKFCPGELFVISCTDTPTRYGSFVEPEMLCRARRPSVLFL